MKKAISTALSAITAAAMLATASPVYAAECSHDYLSDHDDLMKDSEIKKYYDIITSDMSWYTTKTIGFTILDVITDDSTEPEFIVTDDYGYEGIYENQTKKLRKIYAMDGGKLEFKYAVSVSRDYITPYTDPSDPQNTQGWLYSNAEQTVSADGNRKMSREYGLMYFYKDKVMKKPLFSAQETVDTQKDTFSYCYKENGTVLSENTYENYSKHKYGYDSVATGYYKKWYNDAGTWEAENFENALSDLFISATPPIMWWDEFYTVNENGQEEYLSYCIDRNCPQLKDTIARLIRSYNLNGALLQDRYSYYVSSDADLVLYVEKPVIYLYPEKTENVSVKLDLNGELICTYPEYENGWCVTAEPDGTIHTDDGEEYSYLYWEGNIGQSWDMSEGFVVKGSDTAEFLKEKLSYMGLTPKEYNEFIVYWLPHMQGNKYNLITFQTDAYEQAAAMYITPEPDSVLRVFMTFKALDKEEDIPEQKLESFERRGFTVVEWGGAEI